MGYYTEYNLEIVKGDHEVIGELREYSECAQIAIDNNGDCEESCRWYDFEKEMKMFSEKHPDVLFKLSGNGQEGGDQWHSYFQDGKNQHCKNIITFDPYDETKMS